MKAAIVKSFKEPLVVEETLKPEISYNEVLVRITACGVCHTDLHAAHGDWPVKPKLPLIPGHEGVGVIEQVGPGVTHLKVGDRVGIPWLYTACGHCEYCLTGRETLCHDQLNSGYSVDGGYAEYCKADANYVVKVPENLSSVEAAPIFCAGVTTYKALKVSKAKPGEWVSIFGIGGLGHVAIQYAKAMGLKVVAVDTGNEKLELAKSLGADLVINPIDEDAGEWIHREVGGVHGSICTAVSKQAFGQSYRSVRRGGVCVAVGLPPEEMSIPIFDTVLNGVEVVGSIVGTRKDLQEALQFAAEGKVKTIVEVRPLEDINEVFDDMIHGKINGRVVLSFE
ncbi:alcohol dehydrogenase AdhP [Ammoniphilus sp. CFH 90114]|uniref:alcohol dehydrogenase AdhP n=1 Tax=Ammoniphilus sp. CFH 90114 TaxID=2493665 RepID=UPI00100EB316|nr:alcohol dehydrogenase AdhP [Ammoniphilus sp. CFH 90114]RXT06521.1 alcohol dehydrogenase AdhP [Ammoniphilus sp. CFH 90114]